jgi:hypothetical protein
MARTRFRHVHFVMSDQEYAQMCKKIESLGIRNHAAYLRKMALNGYCIQLDLPEIRKMTSLLGRCCSNLNQYAKKANETGSIYEEDILDLQERLEKIYAQTEKILIQLNALQ